MYDKAFMPLVVRSAAAQRAAQIRELESILKELNPDFKPLDKLFF